MASPMNQSPNDSYSSESDEFGNERYISLSFDGTSWDILCHDDAISIQTLKDLVEKASGLLYTDQVQSRKSKKPRLTVLYPDKKGLIHLVPHISDNKILFPLTGNNSNNPKRVGTNAKRSAKELRDIEIMDVIKDKKNPKTVEGSEKTQKSMKLKIGVRVRFQEPSKYRFMSGFAMNVSHVDLDPSHPHSCEKVVSLIENALRNRYTDPYLIGTHKVLGMSDGFEIPRFVDENGKICDLWRFTRTHNNGIRSSYHTLRVYLLITAPKIWGQANSEPLTSTNSKSQARISKSAASNQAEKTNKNSRNIPESGNSVNKKKGTCSEPRKASHSNVTLIRSKRSVHLSSSKEPFRGFSNDTHTKNRDYKKIPLVRKRLTEQEHVMDKNRNRPGIVLSGKTKIQNEKTGRDDESSSTESQYKSDDGDGSSCSEINSPEFSQVSVGEAGMKTTEHAFSVSSTSDQGNGSGWLIESETLTRDDALIIASSNASALRVTGHEVSAKATHVNKPMVQLAAHQIQREAFEIDTEKKEGKDVLKCIGKGSYGSVYSGWWNGTRVAIKMIRCDIHKDKMDALREIAVMDRSRHTNIPSLLAYCIHENEYWDKFFIIMELVQGHDLATVLFSKYSRKTFQLDLSVEHSLAIQGAAAVCFLHSCKPPILHRDIKPDNFMMTSNFGLKLCDFGFGKTNNMPDQLWSVPGRSNAKGTIAYMAPEIITLAEDATTASDVWSLAIVVLEIFTQRRTWQVPNPDLAVMKRIFKSIRTPDSFETPTSLHILFDRVFMRNPQARCSALEIVEFLHAAQTVASS
ncbi:hypothetical protein QAD02_002887 [Eretmocerus hayati]|uniref:Uncharacterized protein n=1 Tax=Eretmocerus hayati TaxID=131215 RepID=A0ACC2NLF1_9HYME|nr:hypothetical protein QAD02_002887 [Eretmocerus hayati]